MKFIVDLWLDGYDNERDMEEACVTYMYDVLDFSGSTVTITKYIEPEYNLNAFLEKCD